MEVSYKHLPHDAKKMPCRGVARGGICAKPPPTPPELIEGILHRGSKMALGGASTSFGTWTFLEPPYAFQVAGNG